jgi:hypothetical protein
MRNGRSVTLKSFSVSSGVSSITWRNSFFYSWNRKINTARMYYSGEPGCKLCWYLQREREESVALSDIRFKFGQITRPGRVTVGPQAHISRIYCLHRWWFIQLLKQMNHQTQHQCMSLQDETVHTAGHNCQALGRPPTNVSCCCSQYFQHKYCCVSLHTSLFISSHAYNRKRQIPARFIGHSRVVILRYANVCHFPGPQYLEAAPRLLKNLREPSINTSPALFKRQVVVLMRTVLTCSKHRTYVHEDVPAWRWQIDGYKMRGCVNGFIQQMHTLILRLMLCFVNNNNKYLFTGPSDERHKDILSSFVSRYAMNFGPCIKFSLNMIWQTKK